MSEVSASDTSHSESIRKIVEARAKDPGASHQITQLDPERKERIADKQSDRDLKRRYAKYFLFILAGQLVVMNSVFMAHGFGWLDYDKYVLHLYMGGTLLEIFGVVLVITRSLFPAAASGNVKTEK